MYILRKDNKGINIIDKRSMQGRILTEAEEKKIIQTVPELSSAKIVTFYINKSYRNLLDHEITEDSIKNSFFYSNYRKK